jgi:hypothetical protein
MEALVAALLTMIGAGAGFGVRRSRHEPNTPEPSTLTSQLTTLTQQQAETTAKIAEVVTTLDRIVTADLGRIEDRVQRHRRAHQRLAADVDAVSDALDIIVTHIGDQLPDQAKRSVSAKLQRQQRHDVTGVRSAAKS